MKLLFNTDEFFQEERPTRPTKKQVELFLKTKANEIISQGFSSDRIEDIVSDLRGLLNFTGNGYELAKELESGYCSYEIDLSFIEWLDSLESDFSYVNVANVKEWVKAHKIKPKLSKGDKLKAIHSLSFSFDKKDIIYVNGMDLERAVYYIDKDPERKGGVLIPFEIVELKTKKI